MDKVMPVLKSKIHNDESFLKELSHAWKMHGIMNKWMKYFFTYLDRFYVSNNNVPSLMVRGNKLFKTWIYDSLKENILKSVLNSIQEVSTASARYVSYSSVCTLNSFVLNGIALGASWHHRC